MVETPYRKVNVVDTNGDLVNFGGGSGGDASATNQTTQIARETEIRDRLPSALVGDRLKVDGSGVTQPVSLASIPLASGAATQATLATLLTEGTDITGVSIPSGGAGGKGWLSAIWKLISDRLPSVLASDRLKVDGSGVTQPTSEQNRYSLLAAETQLTAPGSTSGRNSSLYNSISCFYTVANINTNIAARLEGSLNGTTWINLDATGDRVITANGTYAYLINGKFAQIRFTFVSEIGGTTAVIDVQFALGN